MPTKPQRHAAILRLVRTRRIPSQDRLRQLLGEEGLEVTQGTLSRDLRELGIIKIADDDGRTRYAVPPDVVDPVPALARLLPTLFIGLDGVDQLLVLKTVTGGAQPVAAALDHQQWEDVAGTIAGDDTILIITRSPQARDRVRARLEALAGLRPG